MSNNNDEDPILNSSVPKPKLQSAIPRSKRRIRDSYSDIDLADRIDCLQRSLAHERGINGRFREETIAILRILLQRRYP